MVHMTLCSVCEQVSLVLHEPGQRVPFRERDWQRFSLGQLVRGKPPPGAKKLLHFSLIHTTGRCPPKPMSIYIHSCMCRLFAVLPSAAG
jgi:hypothetical protein